MKKTPLPLTDISHWIFDMDGTLTIPRHDFAYMRYQLNVDTGEDILSHIHSLPPHQAQEKKQWLYNYGIDLAKNAEAALGAIELIHYLYKDQQCKIAVLTRNDRELALITLEKIGLLPYIDSNLILGRDEAKPKPDADGILTILNEWQIQPTQSIMVGDYDYDLNAGKNAGTQTILVNQPSNRWPTLTNYYFKNCTELLKYLQTH